MRTPFLGPAYVSRSPNIADSQLINLYPELVETKNGKAVGSFYMAPGLRLLVTCGFGPIRGTASMNGVLYVVSGSEVYSVTRGWSATLLGSIATASGPVSIITNGAQLEIFDGDSAYLVPGGAPLTGGNISTGGVDYAVGNRIYLMGTGGVQSATAFVTVTGVSSGVVTAFSIDGAGAFSTLPTTMTQQQTDGAGSGFILSALTFGASVGVYKVPLPFAGPVSASYQEGFGVVNQFGTDMWWQSNLFDLSVYQPLNFSSADGLPDDIVAIHEVHLEQWLFKNDSIEVWINAGLPNFVFQRLAGVFVEVGCVAAFSVAKSGESLLWLTQSTQGQGQVMMSQGYQPRRMSTHALEREIASYPTMTDAIAFCYEQEGHSFYQITFPSGNATWVLDITETQAGGIPMWHQRAAFKKGQFDRHWANSHSFFANTQVIGDYLSGNLYAYDLDTLTDNGQPRKWLRTWRAVPQPVDQPIRFNELIIDAQTGIGVASSENPQCMLRWSDDGGHTWSNIRTAAMGRTGQTSRPIRFTRLGSTRVLTGLDRLFELSSTDPYAVCLIGARLQ